MITIGKTRAAEIIDLLSVAASHAGPHGIAAICNVLAMMLASTPDVERPVLISLVYDNGFNVAVTKSSVIVSRRNKHA